MFKGLGNLGNIASVIGKLQDLPSKMQELTERMKSQFVTESSSCGHVTVTMNGVGEVQSVDLAPEILDGISAETVSAAIQEATNLAGSSAKQMYAGAISDLANELDLGGMPGVEGLLSTITGGNG